MKLETNETRITLLRDYYCFTDERYPSATNISGTEVMAIYWAYSCPNGSGYLSDEYVIMDDVRKLVQGIKEIEFGKRTHFSMDLNQLTLKKPFIIFELERVDDNYHLKLGVFDTVFDEYISIDKTLTSFEWEPYAREFLDWGKKQPVNLGAKVCTQVQKDDHTFWFGREGIVSAIYPKEDKNDICRINVSFPEFSTDGKPYRIARMYDIHDLKILKPGEELKQDDLNRDLLTACTAKDPDFIHIERLLQQGAQPLGLTEYCNSKDYVYHAVIDEYNSYEEEDEIYPFYRITELFLQYGMDLSKPVVPYDDWDYLHPLWSFTFFHTNAILKVLKLLLNRGMDAHAAGKCWEHDLMDLSIFDVEEDDNVHEYFEHELARLMLFASYPHILENDPDLQKEIQLSENDYDPINFRNWEKFFFRVDTSKRPDPTRLGGSVITIFERGTGKEVWQFVFE